MERSEEGFALLSREIVDHHVFVGRQRSGTPQQLFDGQLEAVFMARLNRLGRHLL